MLILHCLWIGEEFILWGEDDTVPLSIKRRGRPPKDTSRYEFPYLADSDKLRNILNILYGKDTHIQMEEFSIQLTVPTGKYLATNSPLFTDEIEDSPYRLSSWCIRGIRVPANVFIENIAAKTEQDLGFILPEDVYLADDFLYWLRCGRFLIRLLCRQKFIPAIMVEDGRAYAVWQPVLEDPEDIKIMKELIKCMPPVCRGVITHGEEDGKLENGKDLLIGFLKTSMDHTIRRWVVNMELEDSKVPIERRWLIALHNLNNNVKVSAEELKNFIKQFTSWTKPLIQNKGAFRTCFRLEEPEDPNADWYISFHLQAIDEPTLLVSADDVWAKGEATTVFHSRSFEFPQERLLEDLGKAVEIFPPLERGLDTARPIGCHVTMEEAYTFLMESSILLQESGFGVLLPDWWRERKRHGIGVNLRLKPIDGDRGQLGLDSIIKFDWQVALGDETIDYQHFFELVNLKRPLIQVKDKWIELNNLEVRQLIRWLKEQGDGGTIQLRDAIYLMAQDEDNPYINNVEYEGWVGDFFRATEFPDCYPILPQPEEFRGRLRHYQLAGYSWMVYLKEMGVGSCLADDMGLGKTVQLIALLLHEKSQDKFKYPTLLICPTSVVGNWYREVRKFAPSLHVFIHHGSDRLSGQEFVDEVSNYDLVISTYSLLHRDGEDFKEIPWNGIVLDEAQNIKNPFTKQVKSVKRLKSGWRIALTGTPLENRLQELWSIMDFLNPGILGSLDTFRQRFVIPIERHGDKDRAEDLKRIISPFILRRVKTDPKVIQDLPDKQEINVYCNLTREQTSLYEIVVQDMLNKVATSEGIERKGLVLSSITKLKQICNHPILYTRSGSHSKYRSGKMIRLTQMLEEILDQDECVLIFTQYVDMGRILQTYIRRTFREEVLFLHGGVVQKERDTMIRSFQNTDGPRVFILSLRAGGVGLNLIRANHVIHFDRWWNPAIEDQATDRAFRIGQKQNVQVYKFICSGTLEERIDGLIEKKKGLAETIIGSGETWITEFDDDELRALIELEQDMFVEEEGDE